LVPLWRSDTLTGGGSSHHHPASRHRHRDPDAGRAAVSRLDRLARSVGDLLAIVARLEAKKDSLRVLSISGNQPLDTATSTGRLMLAVIGAVGQAGREAMLERQREGIRKAQREGRYKGRVPTARRQAGEIVRLKREGIGPAEIARKLGTGRASVYRVLGEQEKVAA